jgi:hypothetical protein
MTQLQLAMSAIYVAGCIFTTYYVVLKCLEPPGVFGDLGRAAGVVMWPLIVLYGIWLALCKIVKH